MKKKRSLSGIFFRFKNPETNKMENYCFEDLPENEQDRIMKDRSAEWLRGLAKRLAETLVEVADFCDITTKENDDK